MSDTKNNEIAVAGTDFFADTENFLNELTDSEMVQVEGAEPSGLSLLLCDDLPV